MLKILSRIRKKRKRITTKEYSKKWLNNWQYFVMFWCSVFFIADIYYNEAEHCVELCVCLVTSIAASFAIYLPKAYFGKRNEEMNNLFEKYKLTKSEDEQDDGDLVIDNEGEY